MIGNGAEIRPLEMSRKGPEMALKKLTFLHCTIILKTNDDDNDDDDDDDDETMLSWY